MVHGDVRRTLALVRPAARGVALSALLGAGAACASVGLLATSAWLIARASQQPGASALGVAIAGVQFFALSRGLLRYAERLAGHDAAFRALAALRVSVYRRLEPLAPAALPGFREGDLLARFVHDVDALQDLLLRVLPPFAIALIAGAATVALLWWLLPAAGAIVLVALLLAATVVPWLTARESGRAQAAGAAERGDGRDARRRAGAARQRRAPRTSAHARAARRRADPRRRRGRTHHGHRARPGDAADRARAVGRRWWWRPTRSSTRCCSRSSRSSRSRPSSSSAACPRRRRTWPACAAAPSACSAVLDAPVPVREPAAPLPLPAAPVLRVRGLRARYGDAWVLDGVDLDLAPGRRVAVVGPSGAGKSTLAAVLLRFLDYEGSVTLGGAELARARRRRRPHGRRARRSGRARVRHDAAREPAPRSPRRERGRPGGRARPRSAARLDADAPGRPGDRGRRRRPPLLRRPAPPDRARARRARTLPAADPRRARRAPRRADRRRDRRRRARAAAAARC